MVKNHRQDEKVKFIPGVYLLGCSGEIHVCQFCGLWEGMEVWDAAGTAGLQQHFSISSRFCFSRCIFGQQGSAAGVSVSMDRSSDFWCVVFIFQGGAALAAHSDVGPQLPTEGTWVFSQASCAGLSSTELWKRWSQMEGKSSLPWG